MGIMSLFKKSKIPKAKKHDIVANESFVYTEIVYHSPNNFIILISLTKEYFFQLAEFVDACSLAYLNTKVVNSSYDTENEEKDSEFGKLIVLHERYYCLVGGSYDRYANLFNHINLSNDILIQITQDIYANCESVYFNKLIDDFVLSGYDFKYRNIKARYDNMPLAYKDQYGDSILIDNVGAIMSKLPNGFNAHSVVRFVQVYVCKDHRYNTLHGYLSLKGYKGCSAIEEQLKYLIKVVDEDSIKHLFDPLYLVQDDEGDPLPGDLSDESLDDMFREKYERFTGVADDFIGYQDIDEQLSDDEGEVAGDDV